MNQRKRPKNPSWKRRGPDGAFRQVVVEFSRHHSATVSPPAVLVSTNLRQECRSFLVMDSFLHAGMFITGENITRMKISEKMSWSDAYESTAS
jgi:hypothetical protein